MLTVESCGRESLCVERDDLLARATSNEQASAASPQVNARPIDSTTEALRLANDALSAVLSTVRMTGAAFFNVTARAPWAAEQLCRETVLPLIAPGAETMIAYHIVTSGSCYANLIGGQSIELKAGQVIVFTRGDRHLMSSRPGLRVDAMGGSEPPSAPLPFRASFGGDGPVTATLVCGFLATDSRPFNPLLENLPPILVADSSAGGDMPGLIELIRLAMDKATDTRAGSGIMLNRLTELMFIEVVRQYVERLPTDGANWLSGLRDASIGRALSLMHARPSSDWNLNRLARDIGLSRSEFAARFVSFVGVPPMQYLAKWRMQVATGLLKDGVNIACVANEVGYSSEASFSRAFKKIVGAPPSQWRQRGELLAA